MPLTEAEELELLILLEYERRQLNQEQQEIERQRIREDEVYFLRNYVYIEDKSSTAGIGLFNLWPKQEEVLAVLNAKQFTIILKARQLGLTWLVLADTLHHMLHKLGYMVIAISKRDQPDAIELGKRMKLMLTYLSKFAPWLILERQNMRDWERANGKKWQGLSWSYKEHEIIIERPDGEPSRFLTLPASPDTAHSFTANRVILDEWALHPWADEIWTGAFPTMNRPDFSGQVIGLSTGRVGTLFQLIWESAKQDLNRFVTIFLSWRADPRRTDEWYEQTKRDLPNTWRSQYPENEEDAFTVGDEAFFLEWRKDVHASFPALWYPPLHWKIVRAYDPGFGSRACMKWYAISPDGWAVCYREYYPHKVIDEDQAKEVNRLSVRPDGKPEKISYTVSGVDAWNKNKQTSLSTAEIFRKAGITLRRANTDLENGWRRLHRWLKIEIGQDGGLMSMLRFSQSCINTIRTYPGLETDKTNPETVKEGQEDHCQDCDRYFAMSRPQPDPEKPKEDPLEEAAKELDKRSLQYEIIQRVLAAQKKGKRARDVGDVI